MTRKQSAEFDRMNHAVMAALMMREDAEAKHSEVLMILAREQEARTNRMLEV